MTSGEDIKRSRSKSPVSKSTVSESPASKDTKGAKTDDNKRILGRKSLILVGEESGGFWHAIIDTKDVPDRIREISKHGGYPDDSTDEETEFVWKWWDDIKGKKREHMTFHLSERFFEVISFAGWC